MLAYPNVLLLGGALTDNCEESPAARQLIIIQRNHISIWNYRCSQLEMAMRGGCRRVC
jgi:hypothetical protein